MVLYKERREDGKDLTKVEGDGDEVLMQHLHK